MNAARCLMSVALVALGMVGLHFKIDYSGWVVFVGLLSASVTVTTA